MFKAFVQEARLKLDRRLGFRFILDGWRRSGRRVLVGACWVSASPLVYRPSQQLTRRTRRIELTL